MTTLVLQTLPTVAYIGQDGEFFGLNIFYFITHCKRIEQGKMQQRSFQLTTHICTHIGLYFLIAVSILVPSLFH